MPLRPASAKSVLLPLHGEAAEGRTPGTASLSAARAGIEKFPCRRFGLQLKPEMEAASETSHGEHKACLSIEAPAGSSFSVCPFFPFVVESCLAVEVSAVKASNLDCIDVSGIWKRSHSQWAQPGESGHGVAVKLMLGVGPDRDVRGLRVLSAQGAASLRRCVDERWLALLGDGLPLHRCVQLQPGSSLLLQRPPERVYVLRNPAVQLSRLLVRKASERGAQLLAAPASGSAVAIMAPSSASEMLVAQEVLLEMEHRFSIVFLPDRAAANLPAAKATDAILRRLVAFAVRDSLRRDSWQSAEFPCRLFQSQMSSTDILQRPSLRVPCVDVECDKASASSSQITAELRFSAHVRLVQPLAPFLARSSRTPELAGSYCLQGFEATKRPRIHVLPRLTAAQVTHIWQEGEMPKEQLPEELRTASAFRDYWDLIHGHKLQESSLQAFARVEFVGDISQEFGLLLTYPVSCLWRTFWVNQPALSKQHGPAIVKQVLQSLGKNSTFGTWRLQCGLEQAGYLVVPSAPLNRPMAQDVKLDSVKPVEEPETVSASRKTGHTGKRRLILPLIQHASGTVSGPSKRQCLR
ncbi:unnamed protein product [Symbiodinium necroappetens]|uniref:Uncharacterized protein n=1 Tax=Symbiodinium necroappetens TaxID=1628268 RepID=A0A813ASV7_9DINO|nr:unnamed protein product [Symbiodinium necroappetens]